MLDGEVILAECQGQDINLPLVFGGHYFVGFMDSEGFVYPLRHTEALKVQHKLTVLLNMFISC